MNKHGDFKFFQHLFRELMEELRPRMADLRPKQLGYLCKGMITLSKLFDENNLAIENEIRKDLVRICLEK